VGLLFVQATVPGKRVLRRYRRFDMYINVSYECVVRLEVVDGIIWHGKKNVVLNNTQIRQVESCKLIFQLTILVR
jgi:hypothetical protein